MATVEIQESSFNNIIEEINSVIIDFWAEWCGLAERMHLFSSVSPRSSQRLFAKVDTEVEQALAGSFGIRSIPRPLRSTRNRCVHATRCSPEEALKDLITKLQDWIWMKSVQNSKRDQDDSA